MKKFYLRCIPAFALLTVLLHPVLPAHASDQGLIMALTSTDSKHAVLEQWQPFLDELGEAINRSVKAIAMDDYAGVIWYLDAGKADLAWIGNKAAIEAVDRTDASIIARSETLTGVGYYAHLIARKDSKFHTARDVVKHADELTFGNGDPNSTSGFVVPGYYLFAIQGLDPKKIFKRVTNNNHENNFLAVSQGEIDVATSNSQALFRYKSRFPDEYKKIKTIWTSPLIPSDPILVSRAMPPKLRRKIQDFLLQFAKPAPGKSPDQVTRERQTLIKRKWTGFTLSDNNQLIPIRRLELFKKRLELEKKTGLTGPERQYQFDAIDEKLRRLGQH